MTSNGSDQSPLPHVEATPSASPSSALPPPPSSSSHTPSTSSALPAEALHPEIIKEATDFLLFQMAYSLSSLHASAASAAAIQSQLVALSPPFPFPSPLTFYHGPSTPADPHPYVPGPNAAGLNEPGQQAAGQGQLDPGLNPYEFLRGQIGVQGAGGIYGPFPAFEPVQAGVDLQLPPHPPMPGVTDGIENLVGQRGEPENLANAGVGANVEPGLGNAAAAVDGGGGGGGGFGGGAQNQLPNIAGVEGGPQQVVRRIHIAIRLDLVLILKLAFVVFLFGKDGTWKRTLVLCASAVGVYLYQTGILAPLLRMLSSWTERVLGMGQAQGGAQQAAEEAQRIPRPGQPELQEEPGLEIQNNELGERRGERGGAHAQGPRQRGILQEIAAFVIGFVSSLMPGFQAPEPGFVAQPQNLPRAPEVGAENAAHAHID